jgi:hypothetical protein
MSEERERRKIRKTESPEVSQKSKVGSPKSEEENNSLPAGQAGAFDIRKSEINLAPSKSPPVGETFENMTTRDNSEIKEPLTAHNSPLNTMEVHHHPEVEKKGIKEYLLEGLMIFLAVFMGFIAENLRERVADHEREQQYMESMVRDLALDTAALKAGFPIKEKRLQAIDTVFRFFESTAEPNAIPLNIYVNIRRALWDRVNIRNTGTINELKNAGGLRLIRKPDVRDSLSTYDWLWERLDYYKEVYYTDQQTEMGLMEKIVNAHDLIKSYRLGSKFSSEFSFLSSSSIIRINTTYLSEYLNFLDRQKITTTQDEQFHNRLEAKAVLLIKLIKKEYAIE